MKKISVIIGLLSFLGLAQMAQAQVAAPVWNCTLNFDVQGGGIKLIVGHFKLQGPGQINCMDVQGNVDQIPVHVTVGGAPVSLSAGIGTLRLSGIAAGIGLAGQPEDLLGSYIIAGIRGSIFAGAGADLALHAQYGSVTFNASVQAVSGLGLNMGIDYLLIEPIY